MVVFLPVISVYSGGVGWQCLDLEFQALEKLDSWVCLTNPQLHFMIETQGWLSDQAVTRNTHLKGPNTSVLMALGFLRGFFPHQTIPWQPEPLVNKLAGMREMHLGKHVSKK